MTHVELESAKHSELKHFKLETVVWGSNDMHQP